MSDDGKKRFSKKNIESVKKSFENRGVIYLGRIPPRMTPRICRRILSQYGQIGRIHFADEDEMDFKERKQKGGGRQRGHVEGWVEFMDKKIAKKFVLRYNGQPIGGKRRSPFYDELWCVKYLSNFKWDHLLEGIRCRKILMQQELQKEMADAKKQQEVYLNRVEAAKRIEKNSETKRVSVKSERTYSQKEPFPEPVLEDQHPADLSDELLVMFGGVSR